MKNKAASAVNEAYKQAEKVFLLVITIQQQRTYH